jgi:type II secretory pathway pseudopilin PulG
LIELLVVISIIGVLSSITLVAVQSVKNKAKETKGFVEIKELVKALELYKLDNGTYPGNFDTYYVSSQNGVALTCVKGNGTLWTSVFDANFTNKYMSILPSESRPCGIIYVKFSKNGSVDPIITCNVSSSGGDSYTREDYEYFIILLTDPNGIYKDLGMVTWNYNNAGGGLDSTQKCFPGPQK